MIAYSVEIYNKANEGLIREIDIPNDKPDAVAKTMKQR
jgi:hypothetical protein